MTGFSAYYFDGKTSARITVHVTGTAAGLHIVGGRLDITVPLADARVDAPLPGTRRTISLPGGAQLQTDDSAALDLLFPRAHRVEGWVRRMEDRWRYALAALLVLSMASAWTVIYGLPYAAKVVAGHVPLAWETGLGEQTLASIDQAACAPSRASRTCH